MPIELTKGIGPASSVILADAHKGVGGFLDVREPRKRLLDVEADVVHWDADA